MDVCPHFPRATLKRSLTSQQIHGLQDKFLKKHMKCHHCGIPVAIPWICVNVPITKYVIKVLKYVL